jgi:hypothetical protein
MTPADSDQAMTPLEAALLRGCSVPTVKRHDYILQPIVTATGRRFYLRSKVEAWIADCAAQREAEAIESAQL